ncbi:TrbC/VirB2 family protein [Culicoidibacter larvae]|uniref:Uncharacterized protein n=1 Tax=Culicoidibacter larvae TaxID=2579976 RepID=A0A5R8Q7X7_9FIRM|nr:TrbC/VirB2 family protein [Culicoidibacter larvae]TLG71157.1 hypothetical protein FEZ08_11425 [Culicoidibacter larvae]
MQTMIYQKLQAAQAFLSRYEPSMPAEAEQITNTIDTWVAIGKYICGGLFVLVIMGVGLGMWLAPDEFSKHKKKILVIAGGALLIFGAAFIAATIQQTIAG